MSHHGSEFGRSKSKIMEEIFKKFAGTTDPLHEKMSEVFGEYPDGKISPADEGAIALEIGAKDKTIFIRFPKPVAWIAFTPDEAMQIAQSLIDYARKVGLTKPMSIRL